MALEDVERVLCQPRVARPQHGDADGDGDGTRGAPAAGWRPPSECADAVQSTEAGSTRGGGDGTAAALPTGGAGSGSGERPVAEASALELPAGAVPMEVGDGAQKQADPEDKEGLVPTAMPPPPPPTPAETEVPAFCMLGLLCALPRPEGPVRTR